MRSKIEAKLAEGNYTECSRTPHREVYRNELGGWTDHLLSENIIFSHRKSDLASCNFLERLHAHDFYELLLLDEGEGIEYIADGECIPIARGMAILSKPHGFHMFHFGKTSSYERYIFYFKDRPSLFPNEAVTDFLKRGTNACAVFTLPEHYLLSHAEAITAALAQPDERIGTAKAYLSICNLFLALSDREALVSRAASPDVPHFINEIKAYIDENYLSIPSVEALAKQFFYSREYLSRSFRQYYNTPLYEYILGRKLLFCANLLRHGEGVEAAARSAGFCNMSSFIKVFRKTYGCTPSQYRAQN